MKRRLSSVRLFMMWADGVAVISASRIVAESSPETIGGRDHEKAVIAFRLPQGVAVGDIPLPRGAARDVTEGRVSFETETATRDVARLVAWAAGRGEELEELTVWRPTSVDAY
jgi:ABC-2 type transport system ATP-binding protein